MGSKTEHDSWEVHLRKICEGRGEVSKFQERHDRIVKHMNEGEYKLPLNNEAALNAVRYITDELYKEITLTLVFLSIFTNLSWFR